MTYPFLLLSLLTDPSSAHALTLPGSISQPTSSLRKPLSDLALCFPLYQGLQSGSSLYLPEDTAPTSYRLLNQNPLILL